MITDFYLGSVPDSEGRFIETIWSFDHQKLEYVHDFIQWLFPLKERSRFNPGAPVLTEDDISAFRESAELRYRLLKSLDLMLDFYGLRRLPGAVIHGDNYEEQNGWVMAGDHNHLRITRILTSLRLLGLEDEARAFFKCLEGIYQDEPDEIGEETFRYWERACG